MFTSFCFIFSAHSLRRALQLCFHVYLGGSIFGLSDLFRQGAESSMYDMPLNKHAMPAKNQLTQAAGPACGEFGLRLRLRSAGHLRGCKGVLGNRPRACSIQALRLTAHAGLVWMEASCWIVWPSWRQTQKKTWTLLPFASSAA